MGGRQASAQYARPSRAKGAQGTGAQGRAHLGAQTIMQRPPLAMSQEEAADELGIGITLFTQERDAGRIRALEIGKRRVVPYATLVWYLKQRCAEQGVPLDEMALAL